MQLIIYTKCTKKYLRLTRLGCSCQSEIRYNNGHLRLLKPSKVTKMWIGAKATARRSLTWSESKQKVVYTNWDKGQPDDKPKENCLIMNQNRMWHDYLCDSKIRLTICELSGNKSTACVR